MNDPGLVSQLLAAITGLTLLLTGASSLLLAPLGRDTQPTASVAEAPQHETWPWACVGLGLAAIAAMAPGLLHHAGDLAKLDGPGGGMAVVLCLGVFCFFVAGMLNLALRVRVAGLRRSDSIAIGSGRWTAPPLGLGFVWGVGYRETGDSAVIGMVIAQRALTMFWIAAVAVTWLATSHLPGVKLR